MRRRDIQELQAVQGFPAITITLPTYRIAPDIQQNGIRLKNLVRQAQEELKERTDAQQANALLDRLNTLVAELDMTDVLDGLALFVHRDLSRAYRLPFTLPERVYINHTFITRDLVAARNRLTRYWVVALGLNNTKLFSGTPDTIIYSDTGGFPLHFRDDYQDPSTPGAMESNHSALMDERHRQFFRQVDAALTEVLKQENLPVLLLGVERNLAFFREVTENERALAGEATGNYESSSTDEIRAAVLPLLDEMRRRQHAATVEEWEAAVGAKQFANGVEAAWTAAFDGRGDLLLVEKDYHVMGRVDESGREIQIVDDPDALNTPDVLADAVDDLIELNLARGGRVTFVQPGTLSRGVGVGLILRY